MPIDPETRESIEELMKTAKRRGSSVPPSGKAFRDYAAAAEIERRIKEDKEARLREAYSFKYKRTEPKPAPVHHTQPANLRDEIAVLSINSAKACIVMRAIVNDSFVNELQTRIESKYWQWSTTDSQLIEFNPCVLQKLKQLLASFYKEVQVFGVPKALPSTKFDKLMAKMDKNDRQKLYRILAAKYHPDLKPHGSHEVMTLINEVFKNE